MSLKDLYSKRSELQAAIEKMAGRKGVSALRQSLDEVNARLKFLDASRARMKRNVNRSNATGRSESHVEFVRRVFDSLAFARVGRGVYEELQLNVAPEFGVSAVVSMSIARGAMTHPNVKPLSGYIRAQSTIQTATDEGLIPECEENFNRKGRGTATNRDLYSYVADGALVLVQVRHVTRTQYGTSVKIQYIVTDGVDAVEIVKAKGTIKRAATADPSPDSPLRFLRPQLKSEWRNLIPEQPVKLPAPLAACREVFKILEQDADGILRSLHSGEEYRLGVSKTQKAKPDHEGGYFAFLSAERAISLYEERKLIKPEKLTGKTLVLCRGRAFGEPIAYDNGKLAFSRLTIDEVVQAI